MVSTQQHNIKQYMLKRKEKVFWKCFIRPGLWHHGLNVSNMAKNDELSIVTLSKCKLWPFMKQITYFLCWPALTSSIPTLLQDIQPAVGRCPLRVEPSAHRGSARWGPSPRKGQGGVLPASGHALCALHPNLQTAGEGVWPGGPSSEETSYSGNSWWCDGEGVGAEKWNGGKRVFRVPLHGWCPSRLEADTSEFHLSEQI